MAEDCPFCEIDRERLWLDTEVGIALRDSYPVSEGHALVVPRLHVASIYDRPARDQHSLWELVAEARHALLEKFSPNGFNTGINDGLAVIHRHANVAVTSHPPSFRRTSPISQQFSYMSVPTGCVDVSNARLVFVWDADSFQVFLDHQPISTLRKLRKQHLRVFHASKPNFEQ